LGTSDNKAKFASPSVIVQPRRSSEVLVNFDATLCVCTRRHFDADQMKINLATIVVFERHRSLAKRKEPQNGLAPYEYDLDQTGAVTDDNRHARVITVRKALIFGRLVAETLGQWLRPE
jgi:hypothetical protein